MTDTKDSRWETKLKIKSELMKRGISQLQMAYDLKITYGFLNRIINGWDKPPAIVKKLIMEYLDFEEGEIFQDE